LSYTRLIGYKNLTLSEPWSSLRSN